MNGGEAGEPKKPPTKSNRIFVECINFHIIVDVINADKWIKCCSSVRLSVFFCRSVLRFFILALFYRSVSFDSIISAPMTCQLFTEGFAFAPLCSIGDVKRSKKKNQLELGVRVRQ